jgi:tetratricopeptide (TPR) repeat protein
VDSELTIRARSLQGHFLYNLGYPEKAIETYADGLSVIYRLQAELAQFYNLRSRVFFRQREFSEGKRELMMAQYETGLLQAMLAASQGEFVEAQQQYQQVLSLAEEMDYAEGIAKVHRNLAHVLARQAKLAESIAHSQQAIQYYEQIGDQLRMAMVQMNLPAAYIQAKQFKEAVDSAQQVLPFFEKIQNPHFIAITAANLAEAYFELGDIQQAEEYAFYVMRQEDPHAHPYGLFTLALVRRQQGQLDHARTVLVQAQKLAESNGDSYLLAYVQRLLGEVLIAENEQDEGYNLLQKAIEQFIKLDMKHEADQTEKLLPKFDQ